MGTLRCSRRKHRRSRVIDKHVCIRRIYAAPNRNPTKDNIYTLSEMLRPELEAMERCQMKTGIGAGQGLRSPWHACMREQDPSLPSRALSGKTSLTLLRTGLYHHHVQVSWDDAPCTLPFPTLTWPPGPRSHFEFLSRTPFGCSSPRCHAQMRCGFIDPPEPFSAPHRTG